MSTRRLELAVLDVNVGPHLVFPLASEIRSQNVPFLFSTGQSLHEIPAEWVAYPVGPKPVTTATLAVAIASLGILPKEGRVQNR